MNQDFKCFIGLHKYEQTKEEDVKLAGTDVVVGKAIISKCKNCGKIKVDIIDLITYKY